MSSRSNRRSGGSDFVRPALLTGTSAEYLGRRPLPHVLRERSTVFVLGPEGSGKTSVAMQIAGDAVRLDTRGVQLGVNAAVRRCAWEPQLVEAPALVLDGPEWLWSRHGVVTSLLQLLRARAAAGLRTVVCQDDRDGSVERLMEGMEHGAFVVVGLRFPTSRRGRLRFARRFCADRDLPFEAVRGSAQLEPWSYRAVIAHLETWSTPPHDG